MPTTQNPTEAARALRDGHLVILPTETVYGVAADPTHPEAVERLYRVKDRPRDKPIAFLAASTAQVLERLDASDIDLDSTQRATIERLADAHWPGPLTMVIGPDGFRVPDHAICRAVIETVGHPILATSANAAGDPDTTTAATAAEALPTVPIILDAGPSTLKQASTVVRVVPPSAEHPTGLEILRQGSLKLPDHP